jgi:hypothetical protein
VQKSDRDRGDHAQRDEDEECYAHANREAVGKRGLTGWDSHEAREPFVEFYSMSSFRIRRTLRRAIRRSPKNRLQLQRLLLGTGQSSHPFDAESLKGFR